MYTDKQTEPGTRALDQLLHDLKDRCPEPTPFIAMAVLLHPKYKRVDFPNRAAALQELRQLVDSTEPVQNTTTDVVSFARPAVTNSKSTVQSGGFTLLQPVDVD